MKKVFYSIFKTKFGWMGIILNEYGLKSIILPHKNKEEVFFLIKKRVNKSDLLVRDEEYFEKIKAWIIDYFEGKKIVFEYPLDLRCATEFEKKVWKATQSIPYGEMRSYQFIARGIGNPKAVRAVGQALKRNPLPIIIPCHRVIQNNGKLGGFSGGIKFKKILLKIEEKGRKFAQLP